MRPVHIVALLAALKYATALSSDLGLNPDGLHYGQMSVGFIPGWGEAKSPSTASSINALLPKPMGVVRLVLLNPWFTAARLNSGICTQIGAYAQIDPSDTTFAQIVSDTRCWSKLCFTDDAKFADRKLMSRKS